MCRTLSVDDAVRRGTRRGAAELITVVVVLSAVESKCVVVADHRWRCYRHYRRELILSIGYVHVSVCACIP